MRKSAIIGLLLSMVNRGVASNSQQKQLDDLVATLPQGDNKRRIGPRLGAFSIAQSKRDGSPHEHKREIARNLRRQAA